MKKNRAIVVTGASGALGSVISKYLFSEGYEVIGIVRSVERLADKEFFSSVVEADFSDTKSVVSAYKEIYATNSNVFGLINNAALGTSALSVTQNSEELDRVIQVNLKAPILLSKLFGRRMLERQEGRIIMISSIASMQAYKGLAVYSATKAGLEAYARGLARELGSRGITVNSVLPGFMSTPMTEGLTSDQLAKINRRSALHGELKLESIASATSFLLSDAASQITGQSIRIDLGASV